MKQAKERGRTKREGQEKVWNRAKREQSETSGLKGERAAEGGKLASWGRSREGGDREETGLCVTGTEGT